jgi:hypothetical protein
MCDVQRIVKMELYQTYGIVSTAVPSRCVMLKNCEDATHGHILWDLHVLLEDNLHFWLG